MKRLALSLAVLLGPAAAIAAPSSLSADLAAALPEPSAAARFDLPAIDVAKALAQDAKGGKDAPLRYALGHAVDNVDAGAAAAKTGKGEWLTLPDGRMMWRLDVTAPQAWSLDFGFSEFRLPAGAELWILGTKSGDVQGPFTSAENNASGEYWTPLVRGETARIELVLPANKRDYLKLRLDTVHHGYRDPVALAKSNTPSQSCNVDVACSEGNGWSEQIRSSVALAYNSNGRSGTVCSGQFINSTAAGGPQSLMLTANHCGVTPSNAASLVAYFNVQNSTCRAPGSTVSGQHGNASFATFLSGAQVLAQTDPAAAGASPPSVVGSDFALVRFNAQPPAAANVFYTGWDRRNLAPNAAVSIHHPSGNEKRISIDNDPLTITSYLVDTTGGTTHLRVGAWNVGTTEPGSSGSGLWNPDGRLVGVLSGGYAACSSATSATDNDEPDWYGRLAHAWETGTAANRRLKDWLDPTNSGVQTLDGRGTCSAPTVTLTSPAFTTNPAAGATVQISGSATGGAGGYTYAFDLDGDGVADQTGTSTSVSTIYHTRQSTQVRLTVTDSAGCSATVSEALDVTGPALDITATGAPTQVCGNGDSVIDPGERWQQPLTLKNTGEGAFAVGSRALFAGSTDYATSTGAACGFGFVDIANGANAVPALALSASGAGAPASDDGRTAQAITLGGGGVRLFGSTYAQAVMSTNGYVSFDTADTGGDYDNACNTAPDRGGVGPQLRPLHDDLVVGAAAGSGLRYRYFATCPRTAAGAGAGCHVFQWSHMQQYQSGGAATGDFEFQALVYDGGRVAYQYNTASPNVGSGATIGLVDATNGAIDARCNTANAAPAQSAICLAPLSDSVRLEVPAQLLMPMVANAEMSLNVTFAVPSTAACGSEIGLDYIGVAGDTISHVAPERVTDANVGTTCTPVTTCPLQAGPIASREGLYFNAKRPGNGLASYSYGGGWYTAEPDRTPTWYQLSGSYVDNLMRMPIGQTFNTAAPNGVAVSLAERGSAWLTRIGPSLQMFVWQLDDGRSGAELFTASLAPALRPAVNRTETWFSLAEPGWGLAIESAASGTNTLEAFGVFFYDNAGDPRWALGVGNGANGTAVPLNTQRPHCPGCPWLTNWQAGSAAAGTITPTWNGSSGGTFNTAITLPAPMQGTWNRTGVQMIPILPPDQN